MSPCEILFGTVYLYMYGDLYDYHNILHPTLYLYVVKAAILEGMESHVKSAASQPDNEHHHLFYNHNHSTVSMGQCAQNVCPYCALSA